MISNTIIILYMVVILLLCVLIGITIIKSNSKRNSTPEEFLNLLTILSSQIQSELDSYDSDIFQSKGSITNNNFDVYYRDITSRILKNINPNLIKDLSYYYTEDAVYRFTSRSVRDYLVTKINRIHYNKSTKE